MFRVDFTPNQKRVLEKIVVKKIYEGQSTRAQLLWKRRTLDKLSDIEKQYHSKSLRDIFQQKFGKSLPENWLKPTGKVKFGDEFLQEHLPRANA